MQSNHEPRIKFTGKTWIFAVQAAVCGGLGVFSLMLGPLFLFQIMKDASGQPAVDAGIALTVISIPMLLVTSLAVFNLLARRHPVICLWREGLEINMIGSSSLDAIPLIPGAIRVAWLVLSLQGFRQEILFAPWDTMQSARITGPPMARTLTVFGEMYQIINRKTGETALVAHQVAFREVAFETRLDDIGATINAYCQRPEGRVDLPASRG